MHARSIDTVSNGLKVLFPCLAEWSYKTTRKHCWKPDRSYKFASFLSRTMAIGQVPKRETHMRSFIRSKNLRRCIFLELLSQIIKIRRNPRPAPWNHRKEGKTGTTSSLHLYASSLVFSFKKLGGMKKWQPLQPILSLPFRSSQVKSYLGFHQRQVILISRRGGRRLAQISHSRLRLR